MQIVAIGDKIPPGIYQFHSRFAHTVNYKNEDCIITFTDRQGDLSGRTLQVSELPKGSGPVTMTPARVVLDHMSLSKEKALNYSSEFEGFGPDFDFGPLMGTVLETLVQNAPPKSLAVLYDSRHVDSFASTFERALLARFYTAFEALEQGDLLEAVELFKGVGFGLTPSGDDFITGLLYALSALPPNAQIIRLKRKVMERVGGCTALSVQFMRDAHDSHFPQDVKGLLVAAARNDKKELVRHAEQILTHGHSSGADTLAGLMAGFEWVKKQNERHKKQ